MLHIYQTRPYGIFLLRVTVGATMMAHGLQKIFTHGIQGVSGMMASINMPAPTASAVALMAAEALGGLLLVLGLFTRLAALPIAFAMLVAVFAVHFRHGFFAPQGIEYPFLIAMASIALSLTGAGAFALDNKLFGPHVPKVTPQTPPTPRPAYA